MAVTKTWKVRELQAQLQSGSNENVVKTVYCTIFATTGSYKEMVHFSTELAPTTGSFVNYTDLSESQVVGWVKDVMGVSLVSAWENKVEAEVIKLVTPVSASYQEGSMPWDQGLDKQINNGYINKLR